MQAWGDGGFTKAQVPIDHGACNRVGYELRRRLFGGTVIIAPVAGALVPKKFLGQ